MGKDFYFIFDMDGVLLNSHGYQKALRSSLHRFGAALGAPKATIDNEQIAKFETLHVTNEWDTLAICVALVLVTVWQVDGNIRIKTLDPMDEIISDQPDINSFIDLFYQDDALPSLKALKIILESNPWLNTKQQDYLTHILASCRDIYTSPTLPIHLEIILGSNIYQDHYKLEPFLDEESYLLKYDRSALNSETIQSISDLLNLSTHAACVMTNRPDKTPHGFLSSPEAELGLAAIEIENLPYVASGLLKWYAHVVLNQPNLSLLKPNPTHALASLRKCLGESEYEAVEKSFRLFQGKKEKDDWMKFHQSHVVVFEDSTKGLLSANAAKYLLEEIGVRIDLELIGVSSNPIKAEALSKIANRVIEEINHFNWDQYR